MSERLGTQLQSGGLEQSIHTGLLGKGMFAGASLDLNFAVTKNIGPLVTFTRAGSATYVGSDGLIKTAATNEPRFDHNPTTGESLGLLVEEQRTNLLLQSENFGTTWASVGLLAFGSGSTLNAASAPDGLTTADLIVENTANAQHNISQVITTTGAKRFSVFAKQGSGTRLFRMIDYNPTDGGLGETCFNLSTGTVVSGTGSIQAFPNGWYRCSIQSTTTVASTYYFSLASNSTTFTYTGDGTSGIYLWGAQLEAGSFPTSYIPTTTAAATRSADVASITGTNFSSWYRQDEGTVFADATIANTGSNRFIAAASDATVNEEIALYWNTVFNSLVNDGAVSQANSFGGTVAAGSRALHSFAYKANDFQGYGNAVALSAHTSGTLPTADRLTIGSRVNSTFWTNGTIRRLVYWGQRLPNNVLQAITQ